MKCKVCGGTGISNTCVNGTFKPCSFCGGTGECEPFDADVELDKLYPPEQTNEEWLKSCNTEQLAEFLADKCNEVVETVLSDASCDIGDIDNDDYWYRRADFVEWLKQPHTKE